MLITTLNSYATTTSKVRIAALLELHPGAQLGAAVAMETMCNVPTARSSLHLLGVRHAHCGSPNPHTTLHARNYAHQCAAEISPVDIPTLVLNVSTSSA